MELKEVAGWIATNRGFLQRLLVMKKSIKFTLLWVNFVIGSFVHDFIPFPQSYFSNRKNFFNSFFVKKGWGWTFLLLLAYISIVLIKQKIMSLKTVYKHLSRLIVTTFFWYVFTTMFDVIENWTGMCSGNSSFTTKKDCVKGDMIWDGFDISGHVFLLTFCIMIINEELNCSDIVSNIHMNGRISSSEQNDPTIGERNVFGVKIKEEIFEHLIEVLSLLLVLLMILWEMMLLFTCLYFHSLLQKLLGFLCASFSFYTSYYVVFQLKHKYAPCRPSMIAELHRGS